MCFVPSPWQLSQREFGDPTVGRHFSGIRACGLAPNAFVWSSWQSPQRGEASAAAGVTAAAGVGVGSGGGV
jgi:hypothetical protein